MIVTIFDGKTGAFKIDIEIDVSSLKLKRSIESFEISECVISNDNLKQVIIKDYDLIRLKTENDEIVGRLSHPKKTVYTTTLYFTYGADILQRQTYLSENSTTLVSPLFDNFEYHKVKLNDTINVVSTDNTLYSDQIIRQAMRKKHYREIYALDLTTLEVASQTAINFKADDKRIVANTFKLDLASDTVNEIRLINKDNHSQFVDYFLENGIVTTVRPLNIQFVNDVVFCEATEYNDINFATDILRKSSYNNSIEFDMLWIWNDPIFKFNELLGLPINIHIQQTQELANKQIDVQDYEIVSILSSYEISNNKIRIKLGLSSSNLSSIIGGN